MTKITAVFFLAVALPATRTFGQVSVLTNRYDANRTGTNSGETVLTTKNVNGQRFGKVFSYPVDASVFAQPLYVPGLAIPGKGTHNVLFACTMNDTVYAFDADRNLTLWSVNFTNPAAGITPVPIADITGSNDLNIVGPVGIESTPVIDPASQTLYLLARTKEVTGSSTSYVQRLHALDLATGAEKFGGPVEIVASAPGTGEQSAGGMVPFNGEMNNQRAGLALASGQVILSWASHEDDQPYHGWVMSYDAATLAQTGVFCTTPNGAQGGVWQSGRAPVVDSFGDVFFMVGNGTTDKAGDFGESVLRFSSKGGLKFTDYFVASNANSLNSGDVDLGASGPILMPTFDLLVGGGKQGVLYLLKPANLGGIAAGDTQIPQKFQATSNEIKPGPSFWTSASLGPLLYLWGESDYLKAFHFNGTTFDTAPLLESTLTTPQGAPGATVTISSNGSADASAIVWASMAVNQDADHGVVSGMLRALSATDPTQELWNSLQNPTRDDTGLFAKFVPPVVVNGKVYMASFSDYSTPIFLNVYGMLTVSKQFSLGVTPAGLMVQPGAAGEQTVAVSAAPGYAFSGSVALSASGLPAGVTASFQPAVVTGVGSAVMTVAVGAGVPLGSFSFTITGTGVKTGVTQTAAATLTVTNATGAIGINFVGTGTTLNATDIAGVIPKANWNNLTQTAQAQPQPLVDEFGNGTGATVTWAGQNLYSLEIANSPPNFTMMNGYLDDQNGGTTTVAVNGLVVGTNAYSVYVYADGSNGEATRTASYTVSGPGFTTTSFTLSDLPGVNFAGTFQQVTAAQAAGNYVVFQVPGPSFTLSATPVASSDGNLRAPVNGLQVVAQ